MAQHHGHHHHEQDDDEPTPAQMAAVEGISIPGASLLLPLFMKLLGQFGVPVVWGEITKAIYRFVTKTKAEAQALPDGTAVLKNTDNARGTNFTASITKDSNVA